VKRRLDEILVDRGLASTPAEARGLVLSGRVSVSGRRTDKAGTRFASDVSVSVAPSPRRFVSRGGEKLDSALDHFGVDVGGRTALDIGGSTGGFTDCLLRRGAARVYVVDTGYGQIDARLRNDPRVVLRERTNARFLDGSHVPEPIAVAAIDVSFISAAAVIGPAADRLAPDGRILVLVKPQFEAPRREVPPGGVVRDHAVRASAVERIRDAGIRAGLSPEGEFESPIPGRQGNREIFVAFRKA
jgi:23S rRNA (cytidine1920-2'-O)/16S rRNA (cytidine1409-2'-O)-methyltransferase